MSARPSSNSLLIIDPCVSLSSPSMRGVVLSLPELKRRGLNIELWCWDCDPGLPVDRIVRLPRFGKMRVLAAYAFSFWAKLRMWWLFKVRKKARPDVIFTIAWYLSGCDVVLVQFSAWDWERRQRMLGIGSLRDVYERATNLMGLLWANRAVRKTTARSVLCVSYAVAGDVRARRPKLPISVLPNCYDPERFHPGVRAEHREATRAALHFKPEEKVFIFVSTGHYRRKGFFLAAQALEKLRATHPEARLLVVGGQPKRLEQLQATLDLQHPGWQSWIAFTGMAPDVEKYFAAADAFLFPSYSEAFALVEVEAAACGLPLFLTPHHGSEMILQDGVNGRSLEFDAAQISTVLAEFVSGRWLPSQIQMGNGLDSTAYARRLAAELLATIEAKEVGHDAPSNHPPLRAFTDLSPEPQPLLPRP